MERDTETQTDAVLAGLSCSSTTFLSRMGFILNLDDSVIVFIQRMAVVEDIPSHLELVCITVWMQTSGLDWLDLLAKPQDHRGCLCLCLTVFHALSVSIT